MKKDISVIALMFFLTRCFLNLYTYHDIYSFLFYFLNILVFIVIIKKIKFNILKYPIIKFIYLFILLITFIFIIMNAVKFININYFKYTNYITTTISIFIISYIIGKDQIKTITSISEIFLFIFIIFSFLISIGLMSLVSINNYHDFIKIQNISFGCLPFLLIPIIFYLPNKNVILGYLIGGFSSFFDLILLVGCLGTKLPLTYTYPGISILKTITFLSFINHLDKLFSFIYLFEYTITLSFIIYIIKIVLKKESY